MNLSKYKNKGYTGLVNLGNTCFLNSCIQILNHTYELNFIIEKNKHVNTSLSDSLIYTEWKDLHKLMWSNNGVISPNKFVANVQKTAEIKNKEMFTGWNQNDMPEFLMFIIDCLHNSMARGVNIKISGNKENDTDVMATECYEMLKRVYSKEYSEIMELFYGVQVSIVETLDGRKHYSRTPEHFFILNLTIPISEKKETVTIYDCIDLYMKSEIMEGTNAWYNEKTKQKESVKRRTFFWNFPKVLVIMLNRFSPDGEKKLNNMVDFPVDNLDLSKYVRGYNASTYKYELYGVGNHYGSMGMGHYTSFVRNYNNEWIHFNDQQATIMNEPVVTSFAYCLFYRKKNNLL